MPGAERRNASDAPAEETGVKQPLAYSWKRSSLRRIIEAQGATIAALQAQVEAMKGQQTLQQAAAVAQQAQQTLGENVAKMAKESGAADGARLALDGTWIPPAESQATQ